MKSVLGLAGVLAVTLFAAPAFASDLYLPQDPYLPETAPLGWTGAYVGASVGYGWSNADRAVGPDLESDGWLAGVQAGYNLALDGIVLGVEGDLAWTDLDAGDGFNSASIDWLGTLRGRVGFAADAFLIYGTAGIAFAGATASLYPEFIILAPLPATESSNTHVGWVVGAGVETMLTDAISLKAEYLYHDFGTESYGPGFESEELALNVSTVKVGLNFHF